MFPTPHYPQVVSSTLLGAAIGSFTGGGFADALGRRKAFLLAALPMLLGPLLSATAGTYNAMVAGRFITGLALGLSSALVPVYISEVRGQCRCWLRAACQQARQRPPKQRHVLEEPPGYSHLFAVHARHVTAFSAHNTLSL